MILKRRKFLSSIILEENNGENKQSSLKVNNKAHVNPKISKSIKVTKKKISFTSDQLTHSVNLNQKI